MRRGHQIDAGHVARGHLREHDSVLGILDHAEHFLHHGVRVRTLADDRISSVRGRSSLVHLRRHERTALRNANIRSSGNHLFFERVLLELSFHDRDLLRYVHNVGVARRA